MVKYIFILVFLVFACGSKKKTITQTKTKTEAKIQEKKDQQTNILETQKDTLSSKEVIEFNEVSLNQNSTLNLTQADPKKTITVKTPTGNFEIKGANASIKNESQTKKTNQTTTTNIDRSNEFKLLDQSTEEKKVDINFSQKDKRTQKFKDKKNQSWIWILLVIGVIIGGFWFYKKFSISNRIRNIIKNFTL